MKRWLLLRKIDSELAHAVPSEVPRKTSRWAWLKVVFSIVTLGVFYPVKLLLRKIGGWFDRQSPGAWFAAALIVFFVAFIIANQLRYAYWLNIMKSSYPEEVLIAVDKVLLEFGSRFSALQYFIYMNVLGIIWAGWNHSYATPKPQVMPRQRWS